MTKVLETGALSATQDDWIIEITGEMQVLEKIIWGFLGFSSWIGIGIEIEIENTYGNQMARRSSSSQGKQPQAPTPEKMECTEGPREKQYSELCEWGLFKWGPCCDHRCWINGPQADWDGPCLDVMPYVTRSCFPRWGCKGIPHFLNMGMGLRFGPTFSVGQFFSIWNPIKLRSEIGLVHQFWYAQTPQLLGDVWVKKGFHRMQVFISTGGGNLAFLLHLYFSSRKESYISNPLVARVLCFRL